MNASRSWVSFALAPLFLAALFAFASTSADAAPSKNKRVSPKTPTVQNTAGKKLPQFQGTKNKGKKANVNKNKKKKHHHAKKHHKKRHHHRRHAHRGGSSGLLAQLRRDEHRLQADLNRLKKLLR
jgi:hypothetical protein